MTSLDYYRPTDELCAILNLVIYKDIKSKSERQADRAILETHTVDFLQRLVDAANHEIMRTQKVGLVLEDIDAGGAA